MKIALGTVDLSDDERAAIAFFYGSKEPASRETCRQYIIANGYESIMDQLAVMDSRGEWE